MNRFGSSDPKPPLDLAKIDAAPEWLIEPRPPGTGPGQHRFVWNLRYAAPAGEKGDGDGPAAGVWAPPGLYTVELTVAGRRLRQPLTVLPDPRIKVEPAAFAAEFALARQVEQAQTEVRTALAEAAKRQAGLQTEMLAASATRKVELEREQSELNAIADLPPDDPANSVPTAPHSQTGLSDLSQRLDKLMQAIDGADGAPTPDDLAGYRQTSDALQSALKHWQAYKQQ